MKRRNFIKNVGLSSLSVPFILKDLEFEAITKQLFSTSRAAEDKILVIVRLGGGNDGLNTLIPLDQYDNLVIQRPNIVLPEASLLPLTDSLAFHPAMTGMQNMFNDGKLSLIQNVGYAEQNRSHFRSTDIWNTGMIDQNSNTGWMGRHLDNQHPNFPQDYPDTANPDPFAITMGSQVSATCQGLMGNFSHAVDNPLDVYPLTESSTINDGSYYGSHIEYLNTIIGQTNAYGGQVADATNAGSTLSTMYDDNNPIAVQLRYIAQMISGGLQTKVYILNLDGFDTHDAQVEAADPLTGNHTNLLDKLSSAIAAFQDDLALLNLEQRVAGMTYSEFGRQIASNASLGTDHGDAAPLFLFGSCIGDPIIGANPIIPDQITNQAGLPLEVDFRDVYASILKNWFEVDPTEIQNLFEHSVTYYNIFNGCTNGLETNSLENMADKIYPNPATRSATLELTTISGKSSIFITDMNGRQVQEVYQGTLSFEKHFIPIDVENLAPGNYFINVNNENKNISLQFVKVTAL